jgi:hypothetical protein
MDIYAILPPVILVLKRLYQVVSHSKHISYHLLGLPDVSVSFIGQSPLNRQLGQKISKTLIIFQMSQFEMRQETVNIVSVIKIIRKNWATLTKRVLRRRVRTISLMQSVRIKNAKMTRNTFEMRWRIEIELSIVS